MRLWIATGLLGTAALASVVFVTALEPHPDHVPNDAFEEPVWNELPPREQAARRVRCAELEPPGRDACLLAPFSGSDPGEASDGPL